MLDMTTRTVWFEVEGESRVISMSLKEYMRLVSLVEAQYRSAERPEALKQHILAHKGRRRVATA